MTLRLLPPLALGLLPSACASGGAAPKPAPQTATRTPVRAPVQAPPPRPRVLTAPGLEGVIGATNADLVRQFGPARLEVWEGDARKLASQVAVIVNLAVENQSSSFAGRLHGLVSGRREIHDRQPGMAERYAMRSDLHRQNAGVVRPAVTDEAEDARVERVVYGSENPTHDAVRSRRQLGG